MSARDNISIKVLEPGQTIWWLTDDEYRILEFGSSENFAEGVKDGALKAVVNEKATNFVVNYKSIDGQTLKVFDARMYGLSRRKTLLEWFKLSLKRWVGS